MSKPNEKTMKLERGHLTDGLVRSQVILSREDTNTVSLKTKSRKYAKYHAVEPSKHPLKKSPTEFHL